jgi:hypothetical protein
VSNSNTLFIDVETSGYSRLNMLDRSDGYKYQIVSIGAIVASSTTWKPIDTFYVEMQWNKTSAWDFGAQNVHHLTREHLEEHGVPEEDGLAMFCEFLLKHYDTSKAITLGGHNVATFDRHFLLNLFKKYDMTLELSGRGIDTHTIGKVLYGTKDSNELFELIGVERAEHNALEDAQLALKIIRQTHKLFKGFTADGI